MKKSHKQRQKSKSKDQRQWESEDATIKSHRRKAPYMKAILRSRGCVLPFYDFLDSYEAEFNKLVAEFQMNHPSLFGILEVDGNELDTRDWERYGISSEWKQVFYTCEDDSTDTYGQGDKSANVNGHTITFKNPEGEIRTLVRLQRQMKMRFQHKEFKYVFKIAALLHEIGHVIDIEQRINFDPITETARIIDAEVFANRYAFTECKKRGYRQSLSNFRASLESYIGGSDYRAEVAQKALDGSPDESDMVDWGDVIAIPPTPEEVRMIGPEGVRILGGG